MTREPDAVKGRLTYAEIADTLDFKRLEKDLFGESKNTNMTALGGVVVAVSMFIIIFGLDLSGLGFYIVIFSAIALLTAFAAIGTRKAFRLQRSVLIYDAVIREEWRIGQRILPEWFRVPKSHRRLRTLPELSEPLLRRMRLAGFFESEVFSFSAIMVIFLETMLGMVLTFRGANPLILAALMLTTFAILMIPVVWSRPSARLLNELREYEKTTGRIVLPAKLRRRD